MKQYDKVTQDDVWDKVKFFIPVKTFQQYVWRLDRPELNEEITAEPKFGQEVLHYASIAFYVLYLIDANKDYCIRRHPVITVEWYEQEYKRLANIRDKAMTELEKALEAIRKF